jgi:hypothetical protein
MRPARFRFEGGPPRGRAGGISGAIPVQFTVDHQNLSLIVELDSEPEGLDLTIDGLGDAMLDAGVDGMIASTWAKRSPDGRDWAKLRPMTVKRKGHSTIGIQSGGMLDPSNFTFGPRQVEARWAMWSYPRGGNFAKALNFHQGNDRQEARPIVGWTQEAKRRAEELVADAVFRLDDEEADDDE